MKNRGRSLETVYEKICKTRLPSRPTAADYLTPGVLLNDFIELSGDRACGDDQAIIGGIGLLEDLPVTVIGIEKGKDLQEKLRRNFGAVLPEGYRKALRLMKQAEKFHRPVLCFVDTQGANCGKQAEERGIGAAIAENLYVMSDLKTPILTVMIGEGGSGGALALSVADEIWMLENSYYSVITPESCASILFKDPKRAQEAAEHLGLTAEYLLHRGMIDRVLREPMDFSDPDQRARFFHRLHDELYQKLRKLKKLDPEILCRNRYEKYRNIGRRTGVRP